MPDQAQSNDARRADLSADAANLNLVGFWDVEDDIEPKAPRPRVHPHVWKWRDIEPQIRRAADVVSLEDADRRALILSNPGLAPKPFATDTLFGAYSLYNPGEQAAAHRHTPNASRFLLEGDGGYTTVDGEKCMMLRGDLILTPNGTWHDHGNDGDKPIIWMDVLDLPLIEGLNQSIFDLDYTELDPNSNTGDAIPQPVQTIRHQDDHSNRLYGSGGMVPLFGETARGSGDCSPMLVYRGARTRAQLDEMRAYEGCPYDGIILEFVDPVTGGPVMSTMSYRAQLLAAGRQTRAHRHTTSALYCVVDGSGTAVVDGKRLDWERNDAFVIPAWAWHHFEITGDEDAVLYSVTDTPTIKKLNLYREEGRNEDGDVIRVAP